MLCSSLAFLLNNHARFSRLYQVWSMSSTNEQNDPKGKDVCWMHHQHCYWLISSGLIIKSGIFSKLLAPQRLSFLLFDLKCLLKRLLFTEFLQVDIKVELSESIFITLQSGLNLKT